MSGRAPRLLQGQLQQWWRQLAPRERLLLSTAVGLVAIALCWFVALQPAWRTLARAPAEMDRLDGQLQAMQRLAEEAQQLRAAAPVGAEQSAAALKAATDRLGDQAKLTMQGERALLTLNNVGTAALRDWLAEVRAGARARPIEANLTRSAQGYTGTLVVSVGGGQ